MKKLILTSLVAAFVVGVSSAQNLVDTNFNSGGYYVSLAGNSAMGNDIGWSLPNGLASVNLGNMVFSTLNLGSAPVPAFARIRFFNTFDDNASATQPIYAGVSTTLTVNMGNVGTGWYNWTVPVGGVVNITPANAVAYDITYFTDSTMTTRAALTQIFSDHYVGGLPFAAGTSLVGWGVDGAPADDVYTGAEYWAFGPPYDTLAPIITLTPKGTKITGTITLQDWVPPTTDKAVSYELRDSGGVVKYSGTVTLDVAGAYTAIIPDTIAAGTYDMAFKGTTWLFKKNSVTIDGATPITGNDYSLLNGNCANSDQVVDLTDYSQVATAFNSLLADPNNGGLPSANWDPLADVNGDGGVDLTDYTVVVSNFNALGD